MAFKIYTKTGDKGTTGLFGGKRVSKDDLRIEAYGTVDELNSYLGVVHESLDHAELKDDVVVIQNWLFAFGSFLATAPGKNPGIDLPDSEASIWLEQKMDVMEADLPALKNFILPNGHIISAHTHVARCICRRAERRIVALDTAEGVESSILIFFNRLSDYLFMLARYVSLIHGAADHAWQPRKK